jgi:hypothetical protein
MFPGHPSVWLSGFPVASSDLALKGEDVTNDRPADTGSSAIGFYATVQPRTKFVDLLERKVIPIGLQLAGGEAD